MEGPLVDTRLVPLTGQRFCHHLKFEAAVEMENNQLPRTVAESDHNFITNGSRVSMLNVSQRKVTDIWLFAEKIPSIISIPFPTTRLASSALRALQVDEELSSLVQRSFSLTSNVSSKDFLEIKQEEDTILITEYKATTNRMLRVAVNGFMESLGVVLGVMEELDIDVLPAHPKKGS